MARRRGGRASSTIARRAPVVALIAVTAVIATIVLSNGRAGHTLRAAFAAALQVVPGQHVEIAGRTVGSVTGVNLVDGYAVVAMQIDDSVWPLHRGTTAALRYGSPLGYALRYVDLHPGPASAPPLPDGGILSYARTLTPVEFDDIPRTFDPATRRDLGALLANAGAALRGQGGGLSRTLAAGAPAMQNISQMTAELAADPYALRTLVSSAARATAQLARYNDQVGPLIDDAATTTGVLISRARQLAGLLDQAPPAFSAAVRTLGHFNRSTAGLEQLIRALAPGATALDRFAPKVSRLTTNLIDEAPQVSSLLQTAIQASPLVTRFLDQARTQLPATGRGLRGLGPVLDCLRPYTPELAGFLATSQTVYGNYDGAGHYVRTADFEAPYTSPSALTPAQVVKLFPNIHYAFPRPPGLNVGQPWFQPQCGITAAGLNPSNDREAR